MARIKDFREISPQNYNITLDLRDVDKPYIPGLCPRYSNWSFYGLPCDGKVVRWICHITLKDLKVHLKRNQLDDGDQHCYVINKVDVAVDTRAATGTRKPENPTRNCRYPTRPEQGF